MQFTAISKKINLRSRRSRPLNETIDERNIICQYCDTKFSDIKRLQIHMRIECWYQLSHNCKLCSAKFAQSIGLRRHQVQEHNVYIPPILSKPKILFNVPKKKCLFIK